MILIINTADQKKIFLGLVKQDKFLAKKEFEAEYQQAEKLLKEIDKLLSRPATPERQRGEQAIKLTSLQAIVVISGPGPFTALRIGITVANTLGWALNIPVLGIKLTEFSDLSDLLNIIKKKTVKVKAGKIVEPFYDKEPNITLKK